MFPPAEKQQVPVLPTRKMTLRQKQQQQQAKLDVAVEVPRPAALVQPEQLVPPVAAAEAANPPVTLLGSGMVPLNSVACPYFSSPAMPNITQVPAPAQTQEQTIAELQQQQEKLMRQLQRYELQLNAQKQMLEMMNTAARPTGNSVLVMNGTAMVPMQIAPIMPMQSVLQFTNVSQMTPMSQGAPMMPMMPMIPTMTPQMQLQHKF